MYSNLKGGKKTHPKIPSTTMKFFKLSGILTCFFFIGETYEHNMQTQIQTPQFTADKRTSINVLNMFILTLV